MKKRKEKVDKVFRRLLPNSLLGKTRGKKTQWEKVPLKNPKIKASLYKDKGVWVVEGCLDVVSSL